MKKSIVLVMAVLAAGYVFAEDANAGKHGDMPKRERPSLEKLDTDKDGKVSLAEFTAGAPKDATPERIAEHFKKLDANGDGFATKEEFAAMREKMQQHGGTPGEHHGDKKGGGDKPK